MNNRKTTLVLISATVLLAALCSGFIFKKKAEDQKEAAEQNEKLAAQEVNITELKGKIDEQNRLLAAQEKRLAELDERITEKINQIQAKLTARTVDINESDMSMIREMIEKQVQLNVKKGDMPKMGVVSVDKVFRNCKKIEMYRQESIAELQRTNAELAELDNEIKAQSAGMKTLKVGTENYMSQFKELLEKQASLRVKEEFNKQQIGLKEKRITEEIYGDILRITSEIAKEKGLDLVFERSEPVLPALTPTELDLSMTTHKVLYENCCEDITDEVIARLDSEN